MSLYDEIIQLYSQVIDQSGICTILSNKCHIISSILKDDQEEILTNLQDKELNTEELQNLKDNLISLSSLLNYLQDNDTFKSYIINNPSIQQIITDINQIMRETRHILQRLGIQKPSKMPEVNLYQDYSQIDDILLNIIHDIRKKRKEVDSYLKQNTQIPSEVGNQNIDEDNITELNNYYQYKVDKSNFIEGQRLGDNKVFVYYKGIRADTNQNVTIMKLKNKHLFKRLLSILTKLNHPYIESFIGAYIQDTKITIITNRDGVDLFSVLYNSTPNDQISIQSGDKTILAFKVAQAMSYLHSQNVIHRNLRTTNIHITKGPSGINPMITGFRNSRIMPSHISLGMTTAKMSRFDYLPSKFYAPEYDDNFTYDEKIDVFAFSGILYELLVGHPPFEGEDDNTIKQKLKDGERPALPEVKADQDDLVELIKKCWHQEPKERVSFDQVIEIMTTKKIIFPGDETCRASIEELYSSNGIKSTNVKTCTNKIEQIKNDIGNTHQYRFEFIRVRRIINAYEYFLMHQYPEEEEEGEKKEVIISLIDSLNKLSAVVSKASYEELIKNAANDSVAKITNDITTLMNDIRQSMINLGFEGRAEYGNPNQEDLIFDYRELDNFFNSDENFSTETYQIKHAEINQFFKKQKLNLFVKNIALNKRLVDLFTPFKQYEVNREFFENLQIDELQNDGSTSSVYHGIDMRDGKPVAIKVISQKYFEGGEQRLVSLRKEIGYLTRLSHKYIAEFVGYSLSKKDNSVWLITRFVQNGTLSERLSQLSGNDKTKIAFKIAQVMNFLHSKRILHLDIRSSNVVLDGKKPKVIDFGLSNTDNEALKETKEYLGSFNYMAPEILNHDSYDMKADVYSFALLLWEMCSGRMPFANEDNKTIKRKASDGIKLEFPDNVSSALKELISQAASIDPSKRPSFDQIINRMIHMKIMFPDADTETINKFYEKKRKD